MGYLVGIFITGFLAELGDKTQIATLLFAAEGKHHPILIFATAASALAASTALAVALGSLAEQRLAALPLKAIAGTGFIVIGLWTLADGLRGA
ncbi:MAG: TMEM165/GDT1 family protein [Caulobacterales bacterium]|nr:TMEM165/GDT1 family protein [Caulobacterales bacterium]